MTNPDTIPVIPGIILAAIVWAAAIRWRCWR